MKVVFKPNIFTDTKNLKSIKIKSLELKTRIKFILSLLCDFSTELSIKFCDTQEMLETNSAFRKKSYATDVLSFPSPTAESEKDVVYLGDILICVPVCEAQAKKAKHSLCAELEKMIIHGIVHLKGLDHERNPSAYRVMSCLEESLQKELVKVCKKPTWCLNGVTNVR